MKDLFWTQVFQSLQDGKQVLVATEVLGNDPGRSGLYRQDGSLLAGEDIGLGTESGLVSSGPVTLFQQWLWPQPGLVIFGGGHVAVPVAQIGALLGFDITVCDDRSEFATPHRFPQARVIVAPYEKAFDLLDLNPRHYLIIVTRGHVYDRTCLVRALATDAAYIGVIGSLKKATETEAWLLEQGFSSSQVKRVFSPIGLNIGASTPEEIAVSIAAEIIKEKSSRPNSTGIEKIAEALATKPTGEDWALMTIVSAHGSTPRGTGTRMVLKAGGETIGTIGGGFIERNVLAAASDVMETKAPRLMDFSLDNALAAQEGMVCGGSMTVFIEPK